MEAYHNHLAQALLSQNTKVVNLFLPIHKAGLCVSLSLLLIAH